MGKNPKFRDEIGKKFRNIGMKYQKKNPEIRRLVIQFGISLFLNNFVCKYTEIFWKNVINLITFF